jgi:hypothetical protein
MRGPRQHAVVGPHRDPPAGGELDLGGASFEADLDHRRRRIAIDRRDGVEPAGRRRDVDHVRDHHAHVAHAGGDQDGGEGGETDQTHGDLGCRDQMA